ncbi:MAG: NAD(P)/FAD-dependent oxidoreductase [Gammaproteobacteria bacterium]|nr:MAG: NAD(P)/FAD-dependent oxidoreductase [Gammaproteobacteria bacterium]
MSDPHRIVIVGGGAGGLELATRLGNRLGRRGRADITLIDASLRHIWKPLLHEVAAGTLDSHEDDIEFLAQGHWHHFRFRVGRMDQVDRQRKVVSLAPTVDENGELIIPRREFPYDTLVIAVGSVSNDFGIPGVREHCIFLDTLEQAETFNDILMKRCFQAHTIGKKLRIAIAGAGATGIELAAELHEAVRALASFGLDALNPEEDVAITIIEAAPRILPALPDRLADATLRALEGIGVEVRTGERITEARADGFTTDQGHFIPANLMVWAAGIKAPDFLAGIEGLETNPINQLVVHPTLQTTGDPDIFAFGDCAACPMPGTGQNVPPRAQAAHQQASLLYRSIRRRLKGKPLPEYRYVDYGSLVNLSRYTTVGNLMGNLLGRWSGSVMLEGVIARLIYLSLYKMHLLAVNGWWRTTLMTLADLLIRRHRPPLKLH